MFSYPGPGLKRYKGLNGVVEYGTPAEVRAAQEEDETATHRAFLIILYGVMMIGILYGNLNLTKIMENDYPVVLKQLAFIWAAYFKYLVQFPSTLILNYIHTEKRRTLFFILLYVVPLVAGLFSKKVAKVLWLFLIIPFYGPYVILILKDFVLWVVK